MVTPEVATLLHVVARNATVRGEMAAVLSRGTASLTHAGVHALVVRTIAMLREMRLGPSQTIVTAVDYGAAAAMATVAIASGCRVAPRFPGLSADELSTTFDVLRPEAVVVDGSTPSAARTMAAERGLLTLELVPVDGPAGSFDLRVADGSSAVSARGADGARRDSDEDDVAVVLETSGTSGTPKQVPLTHAQLLAGASAMAGVLHLDENDRCIHLAPLFNVAGLVAPLLVPLVTGGSTVFAGPFDVDRFLDAASLGATWWNAGPTVQRTLSRAVRSDSQRWKESASTLRFTRCGSAPLAAEAQLALESMYLFPVVHAYGMTETAQQVTSSSMDDGGARRGTAGRPVANEVRVMGDDGAPARAGTIGEVQVRGPSVFDGYLGDPALNIAAFDDGWFRTGDLGTFDGEGFLTVFGRREEIMNRGGILVSPAEIDAVASAHVDVRDAATFAVEHPTLGQEIGLAIVADHEPADLRSLLAGRLAPQKRPRFIEVVPAIPRTANGKARRRELAEQVVRARQERPVHPPSSALEERLAALWTSVVGHEPPSRDDDFFLEGGDSLQALALLAAIESALGCALEIGPFLDEPTVAGLARAVEHHRAVEARHHGGVHTLQPGQGGVPVVLITGVGGYGITAAPLAGRIAPEHLVVTVDAPGLESGRHPKRFETLATMHLQALRPVIGSGPYVFVGYSLGSLIALEMARQCERGSVALVLVDGRAPNRPAPRWRSRIKRRAKALARELVRAGSPASRRRARVRAARVRARSHYRGGPFDGPAWVLAPEHRRRRYGLDLGWTKTLGHPTVDVSVTGGHFTLRQEPETVQAVAEAVTAASRALSSAGKFSTEDAGGA